MLNKSDLEAFDYYDMFPETLEQGKQTMQDMVKEFILTSQQVPVPKLYADLIDEEHHEWRAEYMRDSDPAAELKELADKLYVEFGYAISRGWDLVEAFKRVHENNMGRMFQPDGSIKRREDGKVEKNKDYPKVNLDDLV